jgi:Ser/Thr protein kinase RdoA (MazF antagonist)
MPALATRSKLAAIVRALRAEPVAIRLIAHRYNTHWLVRTASARFVLRRFGAHLDADPGIAWELDVIARIAQLGWPVPRAIGAPIERDGAWWALFPHLTGRALSRRGPATAAQYRLLGRTLAELHAAVRGIEQPPQRPSWASFTDAAFPPAGGETRRAALLEILLRADRETHALFVRALAAFEERRLPDVFANASRHIVHSDFSPWNVRFTNGTLSALFDFELAHIDVAAADVAFARRGSHDAVVEGYLGHTALPRAHLDALDALWTGVLLAGLWRRLALADRMGELYPNAFEWEIQQLGKTRPFR